MNSGESRGAHVGANSLGLTGALEIQNEIDVSGSFVMV